MEKRRKKDASHIMNREDEDKLIKAVKEYPSLYCDTHTRGHKRIQCWENVSKTLGLPVSSCKSKWKSLRDRYVRMLRNKGVIQNDYLREKLNFVEVLKTYKPQKNPLVIEDSEDSENLLGYLDKEKDEIKKYKPEEKSFVIEDSEDSENSLGYLVKEKDTATLISDDTIQNARRTVEKLQEGETVMEKKDSTAHRVSLETFESLFIQAEDSKFSTPLVDFGKYNGESVTETPTEKESTTTVLSHDMIQSLLKSRENEQNNLTQENVKPIIDFVTSTLENNLLRKNKHGSHTLPISLQTFSLVRSNSDDYSKMSKNDSFVNQIKSISSPNDSNIRLNCTTGDNINTSTTPMNGKEVKKQLVQLNLNDVVSSIIINKYSERKNTQANITFEEVIEIEDDLSPDTKDKVEERNGKLRKRKHEDFSSSESEFYPVEKTTSISNIDCDETDMKTFFNNLAEYVTHRFSKESHAKIRHGIYQLLKNEEMKTEDET